VHDVNAVSRFSGLLIHTETLFVEQRRLPILQEAIHPFRMIHNTVFRFSGTSKEPIFEMKTPGPEFLDQSHSISVSA
jgi:hypothetical protein